MPYLIDGNNLGGVLGGASGARDRDLVLRWALDWSRRGRRAVVVFDGAPDGTQPVGYGAVEVRYAPSRSADALIRDLVRKDPGRWVVVTDDRVLRGAVRDLGARVIAARDLAREEVAPREPGSGKPHGPVDVDDWLAFFEGGEGEA